MSLDEQQLERILDTAMRSLRVLREGDDGKKTKLKAITAFELLRRSRTATTDGYPTSSLGGSGGPSSVLDDRGDPMPPVNDPVGELIVGEGKPDAVRKAAVDMVRRLSRAADELAAAVTGLYEVTPQKAPTDVDDIWCENHLRYGMCEPKGHGRGKRCDWCYRFNLAEGMDPPKELLEARVHGDVTQAMVVAALKPYKRGRGKRDKARKAG